MTGVQALQSPFVTSIEWGKIELSGVGLLRDAKLYPGGSRAWDWRETDTHHSPGIQIADVLELVDRKCSIVILSRGMQLVLKTRRDTLDYLASKGVIVEVLETRAAVTRYNQLVVDGEAVGALIHSTC